MHEPGLHVRLGSPCLTQINDSAAVRALLTRTEPLKNNVGHCQRCHTVVEPLLSTQWFVQIKPLADPAIEAVEKGRTEFVPSNWSNTYFQWMRNIRDWTISRQLWWGHRIPIWHCADCQEMVPALDSKV